MKNRLLLIFLMSTCSMIYGQDYRSHQSGNWDVAGNWEKYNGTTWDYPAPECPPYVEPNTTTSSYVTSRVTIRSGHTITATGDIPGNTGGIIDVAEGGALEMGTFAIRGRSISYKFPTVIINGSLKTANYINSTTFTIGSTGKFETSYNGFMGWWNAGVTPTTVTINGEVALTGTENQVLPGYTYNDLILRGGVKTMLSDVSFNGLLTIDNSAALEFPGVVLFSSGSGIVVNGLLNAEGSTIIFDGGDQIISGSGSFGASADLITIGSTSATNVTISNPKLIITDNLAIAQGSYLTLGSTSKVTVLTSLVTSNGLRLKASSSAPYTNASLIIGKTAAVTGTTDVELSLTGGGDEDTYKWHYISSPFSSLGIAPFTAVTLDLAQFIESRPTAYLMQGWVAYDGYVYTSTATGPTFNNLVPGKGYNFWDGTDNLLTITGTLNKSNLSLPLAYSGNTYSGHNLLGNPFSSGLNWDHIANGTYFAYPANTSKAVHFTRDNQQVTYVNGVGTPADVTGIIPPMQGFFVITKASGNSLTIPADARTHNNVHQRYKGAAEEIPLLRLALYENDLSKDETVVRFDELAKPDFDLDFDAIKMFLSESKTTIHTAINGTNFAINGIPFPEEGVVTEISLVLNIPVTGTHKIAVSQLQGIELYDVALKDKLTGITTDLKTSSEVSFFSPSGLISDRFTLLFGDNLMTGVEDPISLKQAFSIYPSFGSIVIMPLSDEWNETKGSVNIFDLTGKLITSITDVEFRKTSIIQTEAPASKGMYIIEIVSGIKRFTGKVMLR